MTIVNVTAPVIEDFTLNGTVDDKTLDADFTLQVYKGGRSEIVTLAGNLLGGIEADINQWRGLDGAAKIWAKKNKAGRYDLYGQIVCGGSLITGSGEAESEGDEERARLERESKEIHTADIKITTLTLPSDPAEPQDVPPVHTAAVSTTVGGDILGLFGTVDDGTLDADITFSVKLRSGVSRPFTIAGNLLTPIEKNLSSRGLEGRAKLWAKKNDKGRYDLYGQFMIRGEHLVDLGTPSNSIHTEDIRLMTLSLPSDPVETQDGPPTGTAPVGTSLFGVLALTGTVSGEKLDADLTFSVKTRDGARKDFALTGSLLTPIEKSLGTNELGGSVKLWAEKNDKGRYALYGEFIVGGPKLAEIEGATSNSIHTFPLEIAELNFEDVPAAG
ncbi:hypothetical protein [Streptomyces sp. NPDC004728]|uniref:hypothetical protein n=1 Tax=Streptomyces sp. NPDC004728 TaxID=3154289 RepID=UPI0033BA96DF